MQFTSVQYDVVLEDVLSLQLSIPYDRYPVYFTVVSDTHDEAGL